MATVQRKTRVIGNPATGSGKRNPGYIIGLANTGRKVQTHMATAKAKGSAKSASHHAKPKNKNKGKMAYATMHKKAKKHNTGGGAAGNLLNTGLFVIAGAVGSKLGAQAVLGSKNTGLIGYLGNAIVGAVLWFGAEKFLKSRAAALGVALGTVVQIVLRVINDYTPFGSYLANIGMGDYQVQAYVTPQILVDPMRDATLANGWTRPAAAMPALRAASPANAAAGGGGMGNSIYSTRSPLYSVAAA